MLFLNLGRGHAIVKFWQKVCYFYIRVEGILFSNVQPRCQVILYYCLISHSFLYFFIVVRYCLYIETDIVILGFILADILIPQVSSAQFGQDLNIARNVLLLQTITYLLFWFRLYDASIVLLSCPDFNTMSTLFVFIRRVSSFSGDIANLTR